MFTGLVELAGDRWRAARVAAPVTASVSKLHWATLELGESVSVSGACLTVVSWDERGFEADVSLETAAKTTLGALPVRRRREPRARAQGG